MKKPRTLSELNSVDSHDDKDDDSLKIMSTLDMRKFPDTDSDIKFFKFQIQRFYCFTLYM